MGQIPMEKFLDLYALKHTEHARRKEKYKWAIHKWRHSHFQAIWSPSILLSPQ